MIALQLASNPALARAAVVGLFGGAGLTLTAIYSRRGPMIYPVYAAILATLTLLIARYPSLSFGSRAAAALVGFMVASAALSITADIQANRERRKMVRRGQLPESALSYRPSLLGYAARFVFLATIGGAISAGVAFIAA